MRSWDQTNKLYKCYFVSNLHNNTAVQFCPEPKLKFIMAPASFAKIEVYPSLTTTVDQSGDITVRNLTPEQNITLRARTVDDSNIVFESFANYKADENGEVLVSSQPSLGGSYSGVEPMGLFWSMKPVADPDRDDLLRKRDVTKPLKVTLDVFSREDGRNLEERNKTASVTLVRSYMGAGVSRCFSDSCGFYGTLFLPPGDGPFPGICFGF